MRTTTGALLYSLDKTPLGLARRGEDLRGRKLVDRSGEEIGQVDDVLIDDREHKVRFLRVACGGFLGMGETRFLVPVDAITRITSEHVEVDFSHDKITGAPSYDAAALESSSLEHVYRHYGHAPYWSEGYTYPAYFYSRTDLPTIVGVFDSREEAHRALDELRTAGFRDEQLGFVSRDDVGTPPRRDSSATGAVAGAVVGGSVGTLVGIAMVTGLLPGIGPVVAGGALAALVASAATGAAAAGLLGFLIGLGIPEERARHYEQQLMAGKFLVTVRTEGRYDEAAAILERHGSFTDARKATPY